MLVSWRRRCLVYALGNGRFRQGGGLRRVRLLTLVADNRAGLGAEEGPAGGCRRGSGSRTDPGKGSRLSQAPVPPRAGSKGVQDATSALTNNGKARTGGDRAGFSDP